MRVICDRLISLRTVRNLTLLLMLGAAHSAYSQTVKPEPPKKADAKGTPGADQPAGQTGTPQQAGQPAKEVPPVVKPAGQPPAPCRSKEAEREYQIAQVQLKLIEKDIEQAKSELKGIQEAITERADKIAHLEKVMADKDELTPDEKQEGKAPAAAIIDLKAEIDDYQRDLDLAQKKLAAENAEADPLKERIKQLERLGPCPKPPEIAGPQPPLPPGPQPPVPGRPVVAGGCSTSTDAENLKEYQRQIALLEKDNSEIDAKLEKLGNDVLSTEGDQEMDKGLKQGRLDYFKLQKTSLEDNKTRNQTAINDFKARVEAILKKKPCPPEEKRIATPEKPGTHHADKGKETGTKMIKKRSTGQTVQRGSAPGGGSNADRASDDARTINTVIGIGVGIGLGMGARDRGFGGRGGGSREMSPRMRD
jgi:hypothetical protein